MYEGEKTETSEEERIYPTSVISLINDLFLVWTWILPKNYHHPRSGSKVQAAN